MSVVKCIKNSFPQWNYNNIGLNNFQFCHMLTLGLSSDLLPLNLLSRLPNLTSAISYQFQILHYDCLQGNSGNSGNLDKSGNMGNSGESDKYGYQDSSGTSGNSVNFGKSGNSCNLGNSGNQVIKQVIQYASNQIISPSLSFPQFYSSAFPYEKYNCKK